MCLFLGLCVCVFLEYQNLFLFCVCLCFWDSNSGIFKNIELDPLTHLSSTQPRSTQINENLWKSLKKIYENRQSSCWESSNMKRHFFILVLIAGQQLTSTSVQGVFVFVFLRLKFFPFCLKDFCSFLLLWCVFLSRSIIQNLQHLFSSHSV